MDSITSVLPIAGPITAALIGGAISFIVTIIAKDQKTSEFRQAWIDGLREDVSLLAGNWFWIMDAAESSRDNGIDASTFMDSKHDKIADMETRAARIVLRLNVKEHQKMIGLLKEVRDSENNLNNDHEERMQALIAETQVILKKEWARVKRGELSFQLLKWISLSGAVAGSVGVCWLYFGS